jgi:hypothetical protein
MSSSSPGQPTISPDPSLKPGLPQRRRRAAAALIIAAQARPSAGVAHRDEPLEINPTASAFAPLFGVEPDPYERNI